VPSKSLSSITHLRRATSGTFLYAANQNSDTIVVFRIDPSSGKLTPTGETVHAPTPVDVEFGGRL
jgi:6-phosphogluconolactonase (cycloisomerase 2 family)